MAERSFSKLLELYREELFGNVLPFWLRKGIDEECGGYFTCFSNDGSRLMHQHKFTWSQGRFVWMLARLYRSMKGRVQVSDEIRASGKRKLCFYPGPRG